MTYHAFANTIVPFGMNMPLNVSSCIVLCGIPAGRAHVSKITTAPQTMPER